MKTEYMIVSMKRGEILCEELGLLSDKNLADEMLKLFGPEEYHLAYIAKREVGQWEKA